MPNQDRIQGFIRSSLSKTLFVVVSNREPYVHSFNKAGEIQCSKPTSGMASALDPVLQAGRGIWIAHGSGEADAAAVDGRGYVPVPPDNPKYLLQRVWLSPQQQEGYYQGFSNQALWPLCHNSYVRPHFDWNHWKVYREVNELFAEQVHRSVGDARALVFVQDYHLALLPYLVKQKCPRAVVAHFWHIPWPSPEILRICPWQREIIKGLLGSDLLGFHLPQYCRDFLAAARALFPQPRQGRRNTVTHEGRATRVRPFPIGIDFDEFDRLAGSPEVSQRMEDIRRRYPLPRWLGVGVDRMDYIKGIPERMEAVGRLFEMYPQYLEQFSFVQVAVPSRTELAPYQQLARTVHRLVDQINERFGTDAWKPIHLLAENLPSPDVTAWYRLADFCLVSSLHDGMNLVAKEFVASKREADGVLLLSQFAGTAETLHDALLVNPYDIDGMARQMDRALHLDPAEARQRMRRMRTTLRRRNIYRWAVDILAAAAECGQSSLGTEEEPLAAVTNF